jgi:hypothetical protein
MRIGVCIPGHANHLEYLPKCLKSIEGQTVKPAVISISISSFSGSFPEFQCSIPLKISITPEPACAGKNRNTAAAAISSEVDILSFFDMDDLMHPMRLEIIQKAFLESGADMVVHAFKIQKKANYFTEELNILPTGNPILTECFYTTKDSICGRVHVQKEKGGLEFHNGHVSEKTTIWKNEPFPENYGLGEDSENLYRLYNKNFKLGVCTDILSFYYK